MLPPSFRMRAGTDFQTTIRRGRRFGGKTMVIHAQLPLVGPSAERGSGTSMSRSSPAGSVVVGFVVSKAVGNAVVRNRVKRRLRHLVATELSARPSLPNGTSVVVRALPAAAAHPELVPVEFARVWRRATAHGSAS